MKSRHIGFTPFEWLKGGSSKAMYRRACKQYNLVYFGSVDQHADEHEMVRGVTLSPSHRDSHYCVGTVSGRDLILLQRSDTLHFPRKPTKTFHWNILQVDLKNVSLPHVLLDAHHHDETFYAQLFAKFVRLTKAHPGLFYGHNAGFTNHYTAYTPPDTIDVLPTLLPMATTEVIAQHFNQFDYEFFQDHLLVYALDRPANSQLLNHMLKAGLWLANDLEHNAPPEFHDS